MKGLTMGKKKTLAAGVLLLCLAVLLPNAQFVAIHVGDDSRLAADAHVEFSEAEDRRLGHGVVVSDYSGDFRFAVCPVGDDCHQPVSGL